MGWHNKNLSLLPGLLFTDSYQEFAALTPGKRQNKKARAVGKEKIATILRPSLHPGSFFLTPF